MTTLSPELIAQHQLTPSEYTKIVDLLGREPMHSRKAEDAGASLVPLAEASSP